LPPEGYDQPAGGMEAPPADEYDGEIVEAGEIPVPDEDEELGGEPSEYNPDENEQELGGDPLPDDYYEVMGDMP